MPKIAEDLKLTGHLTVEINGEVVQEIPNLVVTDGKEFVISRMKDTSLPAMNHMAIGTSATGTNAGQDALLGEVARVDLDSTTVNGTSITYVANFPAGTPNELKGLNEAGIFNSGSGGKMLCRTKFAGVVNKDTTDSMAISWTITAS